jgi:type I restriction enzyme M protein
LQKTKIDSENSWSIDVRALSEVEGYDLSVKNPHKKEEAALREPTVIIDEMKELDKESAEILKAIRGLVS